MEALLLEYLSKYLPILIFLGIATALALLIVAAAFVLAHQRPDSE